MSFLLVVCYFLCNIYVGPVDENLLVGILNPDGTRRQFYMSASCLFAFLCLSIGYQIIFLCQSYKMLRCRLHANSKGKQDKTGPKLLWIKIKKHNEDSGHG